MLFDSPLIPNVFFFTIGTCRIYAIIIIIYVSDNKCLFWWVFIIIFRRKCINVFMYTTGCQFIPTELYRLCSYTVTATCVA